MCGYFQSGEFVASDETPVCAADDLSSRLDFIRRPKPYRCVTPDAKVSPANDP